MSTALTIAIPALLACLGVLLFVVGVVGRRVGEEAYCRKCDYNLTALTSKRCPECGSKLEPRAMRIGVRHRSPKRILSGTILMLATASAACFGVPQRIARFIDHSEWYEYLPASVLIHFAEYGSEGCMRELTRCVIDDALSRSACQRIADIGLAAQEHPTQSVIAPAWIDLLGEIVLHNRLIGPDLDRFRLALADPILQVRSRIRAGELLPMRVSLACAAPSIDTYYWWCEPGEFRIDGQPVPAPFHPAGGRVYGVRRLAAYETLIDAHGLLPGRHAVTHDVLFKLFRSPPLNPSVDDPIVTRHVKTAATFEVLPESAPDTVQLVRGRSLHSELCRCFSAIVGHDDLKSSAKLDMMTAMLRLERPLPCDVAFDVFLENGEHSWPVGRLALSVNQPAPEAFPMDAVPFPKGESRTFVLLLTTNPAVARASVDAFSIWDGSLVFPDVAIAGNFTRSTGCVREGESPLDNAHAYDLSPTPSTPPDSDQRGAE